MTALPAHKPVTPLGNPLKVAPVAPVVAYVMVVIGVLMHGVCVSVPAAELRVIVLVAPTLIAPLFVTVPQPPVSVTV